MTCQDRKWSPKSGEALNSVQYTSALYGFRFLPLLQNLRASCDVTRLLPHHAIIIHEPAPKASNRASLRGQSSSNTSGMIS